MDYFILPFNTMQTPTFKSRQDYELAEVLMQPILIRLLDNIRKESEIQDCEVSYEDITVPFPGYNVCIKKGEIVEKRNLWELCFHICFENYNPEDNAPLVTDRSLFNSEGELDWHLLDEKAKNLVAKIFSELG